MDPGAASEFLEAGKRAITEAHTVDQAASGLVAALRPAMDLWRVNVLVFTVSGTVVIAGSWSAAPTALGAETEIAVDLTEHTTGIAYALLRGESMVIEPLAMELGLLGSLLRSEGDRSVVVVPLKADDGTVVGVLSATSAKASAFDSGDLEFFRTLAASTQTRLLDLAFGRAE